MTRLGRIEVYQDSLGEWRWRRRAANGRIILSSSESYIRPRDLVHNLEQAMPGFAFRLSSLGRGWGMYGPLEMSPRLYVPVSVPKGTEDRFKARRKASALAGGPCARCGDPTPGITPPNNNLDVCQRCEGEIDADLAEEGK